MSGEGVGGGVVRHVVERVLVGGVGEAEAKREADLLRIAPAVGGRLGTGRGGGVALAEHAVLVACLVVAIPHVDALAVADEAIARLARGPVSVVEGVQAEVLRRGRGERIGHEGCLRVARRVDLSRDHAHSTRHAIEARVAHPKDRVNIVLVKPAELEGKDRVEEHDGLLEGAGLSDDVKDCLLVVIELEHALPGLVLHREVLSLGGKARNRDKRHVAITPKGALHVIREDRGIVLPHGAHGPGLWLLGGGIGIEQGLVHVEPSRDKSVDWRLLIVLVGGRPARRAAEHRVNAAAAEGRDVSLGIAERQSALSVVEKDAALLFLALAELIRGLDVALKPLVGERAISGELGPAVGRTRVSHTQGVVDLALLLDRHGCARGDEARKQGTRSRSAEPASGHVPRRSWFVHVTSLFPVDQVCSLVLAVHRQDEGALMHPSYVSGRWGVNERGTDARVCGPIDTS